MKELKPGMVVEYQPMRVVAIENENVVNFDVDNTLVMYAAPKNGDDEKTVECKLFGVTRELYPHKQHIDLLKIFKGRGYTVVVWSAQGWQWAEEVVKQLDLTGYVDYVMAKPKAAIDDQPVEKWLQRIYLSEDGGYDVGKN